MALLHYESILGTLRRYITDMMQVYESNDNDEMITIKLDLISHQILAKLAEKNERSKRAQLKVILREEAKRHNIDIKKMVEVKA